MKQHDQNSTVRQTEYQLLRAFLCYIFIRAYVYDKELIKYLFMHSNLKFTCCAKGSFDCQNNEYCSEKKGWVEGKYSLAE